MERLTRQSEIGCRYYMRCPQDCDAEVAIDCADCRRFSKLVCRLGAYEDIGLMPEEIDVLKKHSKILSELCEGVGTLRLKELAKADKDGRVVVLPCKVGDKAWCVFDDDEKKGIYETRVYGISVSATGNDVILHFGGYPVVNAWGSAVGKTVFLTREEAEAALNRETS